MNKRIPLYLDTAAPGWMVQSDFDGTISLLDVTDTLLNRFGKPGWQELEDAWERGEIGSRNGALRASARCWPRWCVPGARRPGPSAPSWRWGPRAPWSAPCPAAASRTT